MSEPKWSVGQRVCRKRQLFSLFKEEVETIADIHYYYESDVKKYYYVLSNHTAYQPEVLESNWTKCCSTEDIWQNILNEGIDYEKKKSKKHKSKRSVTRVGKIRKAPSRSKPVRHG
jgi:hypothetical protein